VDMTPEMVSQARRNAGEFRTASGLDNVEFRLGEIEHLPVADLSVDVVISNCVINLSVDKPAVLLEMARVLKPGGRIGVSDIVAEDRLSPAERSERGSYSGCIAGALSRSEYEQGLAAAGFAQISIEFTREVEDGVHAAIVRAAKAGAPSLGLKPLPLVENRADGGGCCGARLVSGEEKN
jgi:arsenite methyltransferase